jgi:hypothetical protein
LRIGHDLVAEAITDRGDCEDAAHPVVQTLLRRPNLLPCASAQFASRVSCGKALCGYYGDGFDADALCRLALKLKAAARAACSLL